VLVEGFKHIDLHKMEVVRDAVATDVQYPDDPFVAAIASDDPTRLPVPTQRDVLPLNDAAAVAQWLVDNGERFVYDPNLYTN
jgi:molybdopterin-guanine dinucleotide biosynthesis protein B